MLAFMSNVNIQLYFEKGCGKKWTQSKKVLWVVILSALYLDYKDI